MHRSMIASADTWVGHRDYDCREDMWEISCAEEEGMMMP